MKLKFYSICLMIVSSSAFAFTSAPNHTEEVKKESAVDVIEDISDGIDEKIDELKAEAKELKKDAVELKDDLLNEMN